MNPSLPSLHHVGIAVRSLAAHREFYETTMGADFEGEETVADQGVKVAFYRLANLRLELIEPVGPDSPVARFLDRRGEGLHHLGFAVCDLDERIKQLQAGGVTMIDTQRRRGSHDMAVAFMHPSSTGRVLCELCQEATH